MSNLRYDPTSTYNNANVVTLTVGDDLSGEIQSYVAGQATNAASVAADAAGEVAASNAG